MIFLISFHGFEGVQHFWLELCIFYSKLLSVTNQQLFCVHLKVISDRDIQTILHLSMNSLSVLWLTLSFGVKDLQKNPAKI